MEPQGHSCAEGNPSPLNPSMGTIERRRDLPNPRTIASHTRRARWGVRSLRGRRVDSKNRSIGSQKKSATREPRSAAFRIGGGATPHVHELAEKRCHHADHVSSTPRAARVGTAPGPVASSLTRASPQMPASIGASHRVTAATDAFSAARGGFAGPLHGWARRPATMRSLTTMGAATKRGGGKAKGGGGGKGKAKAPAPKPTRPGRKGVGPPARRGLKNKLKDQAQKAATTAIQPDWGDDDDDDDDDKTTTMSSRRSTTTSRTSTRAP